MDQPFVKGVLETPAGSVPVVSSRLTGADRWGSIKARWGVKRMQYLVDPGLYALGSPDRQSPVLVTANYKMSFDRLREALPGRQAWILVLDTRGINVWCAAGKGTFGTGELIQRIASSGLSQVVDHNEIILPQLAAPGVAAHEIRKGSGFKVIYGPIEAADLPAFLDEGCRATPRMRQKTFSFRERTVLVPVELVGTLKWSLIIIPLFFLAGGLGGQRGFWNGVWQDGLLAVVALLCAIVAGAVLTPMFLPWLPGRAFSIKGFLMGLIATFFLGLLWTGGFSIGAWTEMSAWFFLVPALSAYLAMNFTGASTYTSLSGVRKEMRWAVPLEICGGGIGLVIWITTLFGA